MRAERRGWSERRGWTCGSCVAAVGLLFVLLAARAGAEIVPPRGSTDARIRAATYDADQVYRLHGVVGYQIDLEFAAGEWFVGLGAGDLEGLAYSGEANHLFLKPKAEHVATNLTVLTNLRHYHVDYSAAERPSAADPDVIFALRFTYADDGRQAAAEAQAQHVDADLKAASSRRHRNVDYWYCGSPSLKPVHAADDGVHTRLRFAANADLPAIFVRGEDAGESLLNYSMDGGDVIIHRVARRFVLRRGKSTGCIVNQSFAGGGARLDSGTVTPEVLRHVQGGAE